MLIDNVYFLSDAHFRMDMSDENERLKRATFISFINSIHGASGAYFLGDIFDFWFESHGFVPPYYDDILEALLSLRNSGTPIYMAGGNHDWWLGSYIRDTMGFTLLPPLATMQIQGLRITMTHGDSLLPGDLAYKALKTIIRSRMVISIARRLPPRFLYGFARAFSSASKQVTESRTESSARKLASMASSEFFKWDNEIFIMGHIHKPCLEKFGNKTFAIIGDWERHFSYCVLERGELSMGFYRP